MNREKRSLYSDSGLRGRMNARVEKMSAVV